MRVYNEKMGGLLTGTIYASALSVIVFFLYTSDVYLAASRRIDTELMAVDRQNRLKVDNWVYYLESRINSDAKKVDGYQISVLKRMDHLDNRVKELEIKIKEQEEIIKSLSKK